jgi:hypothetical protein
VYFQFVSSAPLNPARPQLLASGRMRRWAVASLGVLALSLALATETARGQSAPSESLTPDAAQTSGQEASTDQAATASADATDPQPTNIMISLRINSPGDNGPVSQTSTTAVAGTAADDAATAQDAWQDWDSGGGAAEGQPQASSQDSSTDQAAAASAAATEPRPINVVVSVRVNSPGDDGPVTQSSTVAVGAESKNAAATTQTARQGQVGVAGGAAAPSTPAAPPKPTSGAIGDRSDTAPQQAAAPPDTRAPATCVSVAPGPAGEAATRIVITIGASCPEARGAKPSATRPVSRKHVPTASRATSAQAPSPAPPAPVVSTLAEPILHRAASAPRESRSATPRPASAAPRPRAAAPKALDPPAASAGVGEVMTAAAVPVHDVAAGGARYELMLALLIATLGAAAVWSYGGAHAYRFRRRW